MSKLDEMTPLDLARYALRTSPMRSGHVLDRRAIEALIEECERRIDPARVEALTTHPPISITPMRGVSMAGDRWIVSGGHGGRGVNYARSFPEALAIAEAHR